MQWQFFVGSCKPTDWYRNCPGNLPYHISIQALEKVQTSMISNVTLHLQNPTQRYCTANLTFPCLCIVSVIVIDDQQDANFFGLFIYLFPIGSTCFRRCFRQSSGALDCIYSFWYCPPMLLPAGFMDEMERSYISSMTPAGSNIGGQYQKL